MVGCDDAMSDGGLTPDNTENTETPLFIVDANGDTLPMGTCVDALTPLSHTDCEAELVRRGKISAEARKNRALLRSVMRRAGFRSLRSEWWHFNYTTRADARANYKVIK